jgi:hypothetical protein
MKKNSGTVTKGEEEVSNPVRIVVKFIAKKAHWSGFNERYPNTKQVLVCPLNASGSAYGIQLSAEEIEWYNKVLATDVTPTINNMFWRNFSISIFAGRDLVLDLTDPVHSLQYKVLQIHPLVAKNNAEAMKNPHCQYVIYDAEAEARQQNEARNLRRQADEILRNLSTEEAIDMLMLMGKTPTGTELQSRNLIENRLAEFIESSKAKTIQFIEAYYDPAKHDRIFLYKLVKYNIVRKNGAAFVYADELIGHNEESTLAYLSDARNINVKNALYSALQDSLR